MTDNFVILWVYPFLGVVCVEAGGELFGTSLLEDYGLGYLPELIRDGDHDFTRRSNTREKDPEAGRDQLDQADLVSSNRAAMEAGAFGRFIGIWPRGRLARARSGASYYAGTTRPCLISGRRPGLRPGW